MTTTPAHKTALLCLTALAALSPARPAAARLDIRIDNTDIAAGTGAAILQSMFGFSADEAAVGGPQLDQQMSQIVPQLTQDFRDEISRNFTRLDTHGVLRAMSNAAGGAGKLLPNDYATDASVASLSLGAGVVGNNWSLKDLKGIAFDASSGELPERGIAVSAGAALTVHGRTLPLPRWRFFDPSRLSLGISYMTFGPHEFDDDLSVHVSNLGVRAYYQVLDGHAWLRRGLARWGGLNVSLGVARSNMDVRFATTLPPATATQVVEGSVPLNLDLVYGGDARLNFNLHAWNVPLEVTSHLQLGYVLTLYGGLGFDYNSASASLDGSLKTGGVQLKALNREDASKEPRVIAQPSASLDADDRAAGAAWDVRGFVGVQVNLFHVALFAQAGADTTHNVAANAGLRFFY